MAARILALVVGVAVIARAVAVVDQSLRIVGGAQATVGEFPFAVSLRIDGGVHDCGGSLIHESWVLTSARCVLNDTSADAEQIPFSLVASVGGTNLSNADQFTTVSDIDVFAHPFYSKSSSLNDVALLRLGEPLRQAPVSLVDIDNTELDDGGAAVVALGWGSTETDVISETLQAVDLSILDFDQCNGQTYYDGELPAAMVCARNRSGTKAAPCLYDNGGPLVADIGGDIFTQIGVFSTAGNRCAEDNLVPRVFTQIRPYLCWISNVTNSAVAGDNTPCPATPMPPGVPSASAVCLAGSSMITTHTGSTVPLASLRTGDLLATANGDSSPIYTWSHRAPEELAVFLAIRLSNNNTIHLTPKHLAFTADHGLIPAERLDKHVHSLITPDGAALHIRSITKEVLRGVFNPHTLSGDLIVGGALLSTYTTHLSPSLANALLLPVRAYFRATQRDLLGNFFASGTPRPLQGLVSAVGD